MPSPRIHIITWLKSNSLIAFLFQILLYLTSRYHLEYQSLPCGSSLQEDPKSALSFTLIFKAFYHMNSADFSSFWPKLINKPWASCKKQSTSTLTHILTAMSVPLLSPPPGRTFPIRSCPPQPSGTNVPKTLVELQLYISQSTGIIPFTEPSAFIFSFHSDPREFGITNKDYLAPHNTLAHVF